PPSMLQGIGEYYGYCVLRAVPTGTHPAAAPDQLSPFHGPKIWWGSEKPLTLLGDGAPNPPDQRWDYFIRQAQSLAYNDYYSVAGCGLCDTYLYDPATLQVSQPIWWANDALYNKIPYDTYNHRSEVQVDGVNSYAPGGLSKELRNN